MDLDDIPIQEVLQSLRSMGVPCQEQDEAAARAAYAKAYAELGKRRCLAVAGEKD